MTTEDMYARLNTILDKATESLIIISEEREKQNIHFSNLIEDVETKNNSITDKFNKLKNTYRKAEMTIIEDVTKIRKEVKDNYSALDTKITELEKQFKELQQKQIETELLVNNLQLKNKKRKWWKLC
jgi:septal ring factor EnvC (AmiA/AmiB activator)